MPLLNIYGKYDHLFSPETCEQLVSHVGSKYTEDICLDTGHIGIYVSSKYQNEFAPKIAAWLKERDRIPRKKMPQKSTRTTGKATVVSKVSATKLKQTASTKK